MDATDKKILALLQRDSEIAVQDIAEQVGLTTTPCWRRIQRLQQQGPISRKVALLDAEALGLKLTVFVQVKAAQGSNRKATQEEHLASC